MDKKGVWTNLATAKVVYVEWVDAVGDAGWGVAVEPELHPCQTIGYLVGETKKAVLIASTISKDSTTCRMHIPKAWITNRRTINIETKQRQGKRQKSTAVGKGSTNSEVSN